MLLGYFYVPFPYIYKTYIGSGALSGKMLIVSIIENNKIDAYFRTGYENLFWLSSAIPKILLNA